MCEVDTGDSAGTDKDAYGRWAFGVVGAMCFGVSEDYDALDAFFFCTLCFRAVTGPMHILFVLYRIPSAHPAKSHPQKTA